MQIMLSLYRRYTEPPFDDDVDFGDEPSALDQAYADAIGPAVEELIELAGMDNAFMRCGDLSLAFDRNDSGRVLICRLNVERMITNAPAEHHELLLMLDGAQLPRFSAGFARKSGMSSIQISRKPLALGVYHAGLRRRIITATWNLDTSPDVILKFPYSFPFEDDELEPCSFNLEYHDFVDALEMLARKQQRLTRHVR